MFIASLKNEITTEYRLYLDFADYLVDTFSPSIEPKCEILFSLDGKTYQERKESLKELADRYLKMVDDGLLVGMSSKDLGIIREWFENQTARYGLKRAYC